MFFKLWGNHQGANPSLYKNYGQELLMWAGVIWKRKIVFAKFRHKRAQKNDEIIHLLIANGMFWKRVLGYNSHTEPPRVQKLVHTDALESAASFGLGHAHLRLGIFFAKSQKPQNCFFATPPTFLDQSTPNFAHDIFRRTRKECTKHFFDATFDDETVAFWILVY